MKIYTFYTDSHANLLKDYFLPSLPKDDKLELIVEKFPQECHTAKYREDGWMKTMFRKIDYVLKSIDDCWGEAFVHADCDIQFFDKFKDDIISQLGDCDFVAQEEENKYNLCCGFFICVANQNTKDMFLEIKRKMSENVNSLITDQIIMNSIKDKYVKHKPLDKKYYTVIHYLIKEYPNTFEWTPKININYVDKNILMHHANWTVGVENKVKLLDMIRNKLLEENHDYGNTKFVF